MSAPDTTSPAVDSSRDTQCSAYKGIPAAGLLMSTSATDDCNASAALKFHGVNCPPGPNCLRHRLYKNPSLTYLSPPGTKLLPRFRSARQLGYLAPRIRCGSSVTSTPPQLGEPLPSQGMSTTSSVIASRNRPSASFQHQTLSSSSQQLMECMGLKQLIRYCSWPIVTRQRIRIYVLLFCATLFKYCYFVHVHTM